MIEALLFEDLFTFCDFVRLHGSGARSEIGYLLYRLEHPRDARRTLLALVGFQPYSSPLELRQAEIHACDGHAVLRCDGVRQELAIRGRTRDQALLGLIRPAPWRAEPEGPRHLLFRLRSSGHMAPLVTASLRLGNDRIRFASLEGDGEEGGGPATLVRVEEPSYFLVQQAAEDLAADVELYYPAAEDLYLPWGFEHPLAELWRQSERSRSPALVLFRADGGRLHLEPPRWQDVYDAASFEIVLDEERLHRQVTSSERFTVRLELMPRTHPAEPDLWLLTGDDRPRLEALLGGADEEDLAHLALAVHAGADGRKFYVVREKRGRKGGYFELGGRGFAAYKGFANLYLPVDRDLLPVLRRDRYRDLFHLRSGELVLLADASDAAGENPAPRLYRLAEAGFEPVERLVDYLVAEAEEQLEQLVKASVFDLGRFRAAPSRSFSESRTAEAGPGKEPEAATESESAGPLEDLPNPSAATAEAAEPEEAGSADRMADAPDREALAERALLSEGQSFERWLEVLEAKLAAGKHEDAAAAFVDTLWLVEDEDAARPLLTRWQRHVHTRQAELADEGVADATAYVLSDGKQSRSGMASWLPPALRSLRGAEPRMRLKHRWLLWRRILAHNRDVRQLARLRDEIRDQLSRGLGQAELPEFLRRRLFDERRFSIAAADREAVRELAAATANLDALERVLRRLGDRDAQATTRAILARAYARALGRSDRTRQLLADEPGEAEDTLDQEAAAWQALYAAHAFETEAPARAAEERQRYAALLRELDDGTCKALRESEAALSRRETGNPTRFLSAENVRRFFPQGGRRAAGERGRLLAGLRKAEAEECFGLLDAVFDEHLKPPLKMELVDLAELLDATVEALVRWRWDHRATPYLRRLESMTVRLANYSRGGDVFYFALKNSSLARGQAELGHEGRAADLINIAFGRLGDGGPALDVVDASASLLNTIEGLTLGSRADPIKAFTRALERRMKEKNFADQVLFFLRRHYYRLIDQAAEAAVSKEKLALGLFRHYQQHDEFLILDRVLRDDPCAAPRRRRGRVDGNGQDSRM